MVKGMAGFMYHKMTQNRHTKKGKISEAVKDFMPYKLIRIAQAVFIDHMVRTKYDRIIERPPRAKP